MSYPKWEPGPDSGWGMTCAGDAARRLWAILDHLDAALHGPDGDLIAERVGGDADPGLDLSVASQTAAGVALLQRRREELIEAVLRLERPIDPPGESD